MHDHPDDYANITSTLPTPRDRVLHGDFNFDGDITRTITRSLTSPERAGARFPTQCG